MQTFLPYDSFAETVKVLDWRRLGKQRVECYQIFRVLAGETKAWANHPAVKMWRVYEGYLCDYLDNVVSEWARRGYNHSDEFHEKIVGVSNRFFGNDAVPPWLGDPAFHASHRSNLLRKDPVHYSRFGWTEPDNLPYVWPSPVVTA